MAWARAYALLLFCLFVALAGCGGYTAISGRDDSVVFPSLRMVHPVLDKEGLRGRSDHAFEAGVSRGRGSAEQHIASGTVLFSGATFSAPADLRQDFTLTSADMLLRFRLPRPRCSARCSAESGIPTLT